ncbi:MAG TPA: hypothetical protein PKV66_02085 [Candidatus Pelethenecus sp.]|nr:hypothetical protein [Candidatus Pelethenecus sp.]
MKILIESVLKENENDVLHQKSSIYSNCDDDDCDYDEYDCDYDDEDPCYQDRDIEGDCGYDEDVDMCSFDDPGCYDNE